MLLRHRRQCDRLLEDRAPGRAGRPTRLPSPGIDGHGFPRGERREDRREVLGGEQPFDAGPVDLQPDQAPGRPAGGLLGLEGRLPHVVALVELRQRAEDPELERRVGLLGDQGVARARVVDFQEDQSRLDPDHVERQHAGRPDPVILAHVREFVPHVAGPVRFNPEFVAEIARISRPGHVHRDIPDLRGAPAEIPQVGESFFRRCLQDGPGHRTLQRHRCERFGDLLHFHVEPPAIHPEPPK